MAQKIMFQGKEYQVDGKEVLQAQLSGVVKSVDMDARSMWMIGTDETRDRDGDVVALSGWELDNYKKNPVFLWAHNYGSVPLARADKVIRRKEPARMDFHLVYPTKGLHPFADMILELYNEKIINASSVGFIPKEWEYLEIEGEENLPQWQKGRLFKIKELLELSGCAVPSNPNALQNMLKPKEKSFGMDLYDFVSGSKMIPKPENADDVFGELQDKQLEFEDETAPVVVQVPKSYSVGEDESILGVKAVTFEESEYIEKDVALKPYPNEHACRLKNPDNFDRFARKNCYKKKDDKCIDFIFGIKGDKTEAQSLRFKKDSWSVGSARSVCNDFKGSFEAASSSSVMETIEDDLKKAIDKELIPFKNMIEDLQKEMASFKSAVENLAQKATGLPPGAIEEILKDGFQSRKTVPVNHEVNAIDSKKLGDLLNEVKKMSEIIKSFKGVSK